MVFYVALNTVFQTVMVVVGHYSAAVYAVSGVLGVGIPAVIAIGVAILLGDQPWVLLTFGPLSSGVTGVLGGWVGVAVGGGGSRASGPT